MDASLFDVLSEMTPTPAQRFAAWRRKNAPRLRRALPVAVTAEDGKRVYTCLCGARDTESARWRRTAHTGSFERRHNASCWPKEA